MTQRSDTAVAIVGLACRYPGADDPAQLWENVLSQRRAFRRIPDARLPLADYHDADRGAPDKTYSTKAAVLTGWHFDRIGFRVAGSTFRQTDLTHWLALQVAAEALADAGYPDGEGLPRDGTGVLLGNTLTGEFSRARTLGLRWPYVRRILDETLRAQGATDEHREALIRSVGERYRAPFPAVNEDSLAGGLSNTIAGRICNAFDLHGGGYTMDGACSSSLLTVASACSSLVARDLDAALVGGVDLSIDPFEVLGFAKTGALAEHDMRVFDRRSAGFWPGEGCGFAVLMRHGDAVASGRRIYAVIRGWGISSDGSGGMTRPEVSGQRMALARAYRKAGYGPETVGYFEGHGTGTAVGDAAELSTLLGALRDAGQPPGPRPAVGSVKALIGHTKAAAGIAGLIKATLAVHHRVVPPTAGQREIHPLLLEADRLRTPWQAEPWPEGRPLRASASAMGFGGINAHITLEAADSTPRRVRRLRPEERSLRTSAQDVELFAFAAGSRQELLEAVSRVRAFARDLSFSELGDLGAELSRRAGSGRHRAAVVSGSPEALLAGLTQLEQWLNEGVDSRLDLRAGVFLGCQQRPVRVGFLFPGQGSPANLDGGLWRRRFESVADIYDRADLPALGDGVDTAVAQPAIAAASLAALAVLEDIGIHGEVAVGHSLGELSALTWAGAFSEDGLLRTAGIRGRAMADLGHPTGAMASIRASAEDVAALLATSKVQVACHNSPEHTVISGCQVQLEEVCARAERVGLEVTRLRVSHAFHSPLVAAAATPLSAHLRVEELRPPQRLLISTVTGDALDERSPIAELLARQVVEPVQFTRALSRADAHADLFIEVGPGRSLAPLVAHTVDTPVISLDAGGASLRGLLMATGAVWALGGAARPRALFTDRFTRPFSLDWELDVLASPCELGRDGFTAQPTDRLPERPESHSVPGREPALLAQPGAAVEAESPQELVRALVARRVELPLEGIGLTDRLLSDLHLNSIMVGEIASEAARLLGAPPLRSPTEYADAEVGQLAEALQELVETGGEARPDAEETPPGVAAWVRSFTVELVEEALPVPLDHALDDARPAGRWQVSAPDGHPLGEALREACAALPGAGLILCLPAEPALSDLIDALPRVQALLRDPTVTRLVLVQHGHGAAGLARTLHLEAPRVAVCVLDLPETSPTNLPGSIAFVIDEARAMHGFVEATYDERGARRVPRLRLWQAEGEARLPLGPEDVVLVTGGGKGITAECALDLARWTGASLALLGRSDPASDAALRANIERMQAGGGRAVYFQADVSAPRAVAAAVAAAEAELGGITAVLHGAGRNAPQLIAGLDEDAVRATFAPKVQGLRNVLDAVAPDRLRLLLGFGSIIGRSGMRGNADYALANEWLRAEVEQWSAAHPRCRGLVMEWSVWAGVGMGARLSAVDALARDGITAIPIEEGVAWMRRLLAHPTPGAVVVTGRTGDLPTLRMEAAPLPFLRFLDEVRALTPGVEIVVDTLLSVHTDPYLNDHVFKGQRLVPAVIGFEAMAQAARALTGDQGTPAIEAAVFTSPIVVPADRELRLRVAALRTGPGEVQAVVRAEDSGFQVDCFRATLRFGQDDAPPVVHPGELNGLNGLDALELEAVGDLYGPLLFHEGRFQRVEAYHSVRASGCAARIGAASERPWFASHLPGQTLLGDPALQDAAIHVHQAAVPQAPLLPRSVERIHFGDLSEPGPWRVHTRQTARGERSITVDVGVYTMDGRLRERWEGLVLATVAGTEFRGPWPEPMLGAYLEHRMRELLPAARVEVAVAMGSARAPRRARAAAQLLGPDARLRCRPDGRPLLQNGEGEPQQISFSHTEALSLAVTSTARVACDLQEVQERSVAQWTDLLGTERLALSELLARELGERLDQSATRVWSAVECLRKIGVSAGAPLTLRQRLDDGWVVLGSGALSVATSALSIRRSETPLAVAIAAAKDA